VLVSEPVGEGWSLTVDGAELEPRVSFGWATRFDSPVEGAAVLSYQRPLSTTVSIIAQVLVWLLLLRVALAEQGVVRRWRSAAPEAIAVAAPPVADPDLGTDLEGDPMELS
jgi:hypothetical protein